MSSLSEATPITLAADERVELESLARSTKTEHRTRLKAQIVLMAADGLATRAIARRTGLQPVSFQRRRHELWRREKMSHGVLLIVPGRPEGMGEDGGVTPGQAFLPKGLPGVRATRARTSQGRLRFCDVQRPGKQPACGEGE